MVTFSELQSSGFLVHNNVSVNDQTFNKPVGLLVQSCYIPASTRALTVTTEGSAVVWEVLKQKGIILHYIKYIVKYLYIHTCTYSCLCVYKAVCMYVGVFSDKTYEKMPLKLTKLHSVSITTVTVADKLVLCCVFMHLCTLQPVEYSYVCMYVDT